MPGAAAARARRWFWALVTVAVLSGGAVHQGLHAARALHGALLVGIGVPVLAASGVQAARIWLALAGPPRLRRRR